MTDREYVESVWGFVNTGEWFGQDGKWYIFYGDAEGKHRFTLSGNSEDEVVTQLFQLTRARMEEIRQVREEIDVIGDCLEDCATVIDHEKIYLRDICAQESKAILKKWTKRKNALERNLAARRAALAVLREGIKPEALK